MFANFLSREPYRFEAENAKFPPDSGYQEYRSVYY